MSGGQDQKAAARGAMVKQRSGLDPYVPTEAGVLAERLLRQALAEVRDGIDAIPTVTAVLGVLRLEVNESPPSVAASGAVPPASVQLAEFAEILRGGMEYGTEPAPVVKAGDPE